DGVMAHGQTHHIHLWDQWGYDRAGYPESIALAHPNDEERLTRVCQEYISGEIGEFKSEHRVRQKDGSYRWVLIRGEAVRDAQGRPVRLSGVLVDIDDLKRAEEAMRASEQRFRVFVDHATDAFFLQDERGVILDVNHQACQSLGYTRDELL